MIHSKIGRKRGETGDRVNIRTFSFQFSAAEDVEDDISITGCASPSLATMTLPSPLPAVLTFIEESPAFGISFVGEQGYILHVLRPCGGG